MAVLYTKEKSKYGNLTGQIIIWPMEYDGTPAQGQNPKNLPAGYLKCDGSKYLVNDYPRLAQVLGTGTSTKFMKKNLDGTDFDSITDSQFMVPDFGSKYPEPTTGANAGVYNNIRKNDNSTVPQEISRSGIGIVAESQIGDTVSITYTGNIVLPSQEIPIPGKPGYTYAGATHRTGDVGIDEDMIASHAHFGTFVRGRVMTIQADGTSPVETNNKPRAEGSSGRMLASTIDIDDWLENTLYDNGNPANTNLDASGNPLGGGQEKCKAVIFWNPGNGGGHPGSAFYAGCSPIGFCNTIYWGGCIEGGQGEGMGGTNEWARSGCILKVATKFCGGYLWGSPDGIHTQMFGNTASFLPPIPFGCNPVFGMGPSGPGASMNHCVEQPATYVAGATGVPVDFNSVSMHDVLPLQSNPDAESRRCSAAIEHTTSDTADLTQTTDPTLHNHRIRIDKNVNGDHTYKVRTRAVNVDPENLSTTMAIGADASASIDSACSPFIVMEYLIKV